MAEFENNEETPAEPEDPADKSLNDLNTDVLSASKFLSDAEEKGDLDDIAVATKELAEAKKAVLQKSWDLTSGRTDIKLPEEKDIAQGAPLTPEGQPNLTKSQINVFRRGFATTSRFGGEFLREYMSEFNLTAEEAAPGPGDTPEESAEKSSKIGAWLKKKAGQFGDAFVTSMLFIIGYLGPAAAAIYLGWEFIDKFILCSFSKEVSGCYVTPDGGGDEQKVQVAKEGCDFKGICKSCDECSPTDGSQANCCNAAVNPQGTQGVYAIKCNCGLGAAADAFAGAFKKFIPSSADFGKIFMWVGIGILVIGVLVVAGYFIKKAVDAKMAPHSGSSTSGSGGVTIVTSGSASAPPSALTRSAR